MTPPEEEMSKAQKRTMIYKMSSITKKKIELAPLEDIEKYLEELKT